MVNFFRKRWWACVLLASTGAAGLVLAFQMGTDEGPQRTEIVNQGGRQLLVQRGGLALTGWELALAVISVLLVAVGLAALLEWEASRLGRPEARRRKIEKLSKALAEAMVTITAIKSEVEEGEALLARLEKETEVKGQLAQLRTEEAMAVLAQMQETVRAETTRGTWVQFGIGLLFFVLGVVFTLAVSR